MKKQKHAITYKGIGTNHKSSCCTCGWKANPDHAWLKADQHHQDTK